MTDRKDFLYSFTDEINALVGKTPIGLFNSLSKLNYSSEYDYEDSKKKLAELKLVLDKILSIVYNPHIKVETNEIIQRSELSGKLSHESFNETMRDPQLWREKRGSMAPEYVHTIETVDSIDTYENRFISLLINEIDNDIDIILSEINPLIESLEEHYQSRETTYGKYSMFSSLNNEVLTPFYLTNNNDKNDLFSLAKKIKRRAKNLKSTEFYKITSLHKISKSVIPTNILIHDKLYSYCYKYYISNYQKDLSDNRKENILFSNFFTLSILNYLRKNKLLTKNNMVNLESDNEKLISFSVLSIDRSPFKFTLSFDKENLVLFIKTNLIEDDKEIDCSTTALILRKAYNEINKKTIHNLRIDLRVKGINQIILVTMNNILREYHDVITFSYYREDMDININNLFASLTVLIKAKESLYSSFCPVCGHENIHYDGNDYSCIDCKCSYKMFTLNNENHLWLKSFRKE